MTDHIPMQLKQYYTCCIERRWHIPYNSASAKLALLDFITEFNSRQYNIDDGSDELFISMVLVKILISLSLCAQETI